MAPLVSVVLPTFNRLALLREAIASVRAQTCTDWELVVVDDGSTDGTREFLAAAARDDARLQPLLRPHSGLIAWVHNQGVQAAGGRYVAFLHSDDRWLPHKLERQLAALAARPDARWSYSGFSLVDAAGADQPMPKDAEKRPPCSGWIAERLLRRQTGVPVSSVLAETALLREVGGFDESLAGAEDVDLWVRLADTAACVGLVEPLVQLRQHAGQSTHTHPRPLASYMLRVYEKYAAAHPSPAVARLCREQQAFYAVLAAQGWRARGEPRRAARAVLQSLGHDPTGRALRRLVAGALRRRLGR
jgi:glycosyltransferase involved in cell wall biosynthesis